MQDYKKERVAIFMIPYLRPDFPPLSLAMFKGIFDYEGIASKMIDLNVFVEKFFDTEEIQELEKYCVETKCNNEELIVKKIRKFYRKYIQEILVPFRPTVVGISLFSFFMQRTSELFSLELRRIFPNINIFAGGSGVTRFLHNGATDDWSKDVVNQGIIDHVVIGEGEQAVLDYIKSKNQGIKIVAQLNNFDLQERKPNYNDIDITAYKNKAFLEFKNQNLTIPITGSRGCVRKCSFCNVSSIWPKFVFRSGEDIVDEMQHYVETIGVTNFKFTDSLINGSNKAWRNLNKEIVKRKLKISYTGQFIAKPLGQTTQEDYDLAKKAGASKLFIGIESGSESVRNHMGKKFDNISLYDTIENLCERDIMTHWMLITGYPTETDQDYEQTLQLIEKYKHYRNIVTISFVSFVLLPDSPIAFQSKYKDLQFYNETMGDQSMVNYWICEQNPSLNFEKRTYRYENAEKFALNCGYGTNIDKFKKTLKHSKVIHENQILS